MFFSKIYFIQAMCKAYKNDVEKKKKNKRR